MRMTAVAIWERSRLRRRPLRRFTLNRLLLLSTLLLPATLGRRLYPIKVFLLAGDDACEGSASITQLNHLRAKESVTSNDATMFYSHLLDENHNKWRVRDDVFVTYDHDRNQDWIVGPLSLDAPFGRSAVQFGPEVEMGTVLGNVHDDPIVIVKACWPGRSLGKDFVPPSVGRGGFQYYRMVRSVRKTLESLDQVLPVDLFQHYKRRGSKLAGMVWWHGYSDMLKPDYSVDRYQNNLKHLLEDLLSELNVPNLPIIIGQMGGQGVHNVSQQELEFRTMQAEFVAQHDNMLLVETASLLNENGPRREPNIYHGQPDTMIRIGHAFAVAMLELLYHSNSTAPRYRTPDATPGSGDRGTGSTSLLITMLLLVAVPALVFIRRWRGRNACAGIQTSWQQAMNASYLSVSQDEEEYDDDSDYYSDDDDDDDASDEDVRKGGGEIEI